MNKNSKNITNIIFGVLALLIIVGFLAFVFGDTPSPNSPSVKIKNAEEVGETLDVKNTAYIGNPETAKLAIVEFSDLECPACQSHALDIMPKIKKNFIDTGNVVYFFKELPLPQHEPVASRQTKLLLCAFEQDRNGDKYYEISKYIFNNTASNGLGMPEENLIKKIAELGYNTNTVNSCANSTVMDSVISKNSADAFRIGINATPSFLVGKLDNGNIKGEVIIGSSRYEDWERLINQKTN